MALKAPVALAKRAVDGYRRTFDLLRHQRHVVMERHGDVVERLYRDGFPSDAG